MMQSHDHRSQDVNVNDVISDLANMIHENAEITNVDHSPENITELNKNISDAHTILAHAISEGSIIQPTEDLKYISPLVYEIARAKELSAAALSGGARVSLTDLVTQYSAKMTELITRYNQRKDAETYTQIHATYRLATILTNRKILHRTLMNKSVDAFQNVRRCYFNAVTAESKMDDHSEIDNAIIQCQLHFQRLLGSRGSKYISDAMKSEIKLMLKDGNLEVRDDDDFQPSSENTVLVNGNWPQRPRPDFRVKIIIPACWTVDTDKVVVPALAYVDPSTIEGAAAAASADRVHQAVQKELQAADSHTTAILNATTWEQLDPHNDALLQHMTALEAHFELFQAVVNHDDQTITEEDRAEIMRRLEAGVQINENTLALLREIEREQQIDPQILAENTRRSDELREQFFEAVRNDNLGQAAQLLDEANQLDARLLDPMMNVFLRLIPLETLEQDSKYKQLIDKKSIKDALLHLKDANESAFQQNSMQAYVKQTLYDATERLHAVFDNMQDIAPDLYRRVTEITRRIRETETMDTETAIRIARDIKQITDDFGQLAGENESSSGRLQQVNKELIEVATKAAEAAKMSQTFSLYKQATARVISKGMYKFTSLISHIGLAMLKLPVKESIGFILQYLGKFTLFGVKFGVSAGVSLLFFFRNISRFILDVQSAIAYLMPTVAAQKSVQFTFNVLNGIAGYQVLKITHNLATQTLRYGTRLVAHATGTAPAPAVEYQQHVDRVCRPGDPTLECIAARRTHAAVFAGTAAQRGQVFEPTIRSLIEPMHEGPFEPLADAEAQQILDRQAAEMTRMVDNLPPEPQIGPEEHGEIVQQILEEFNRVLGQPQLRGTPGARMRIAQEAVGVAHDILHPPTLRDLASEFMQTTRQLVEGAQQLVEGAAGGIGAVQDLTANWASFASTYNNMGLAYNLVMFLTTFCSGIYARSAIGYGQTLAIGYPGMKGGWRSKHVRRRYAIR